MTNEAFAALPDPISSALTARGFTELTAVQKAVVDAESKGRDLRISSQTGSGKTVAIGLALAGELAGLDAGQTPSARGPSVLVLVPTRELAMQVRDELAWLFEGVRGLGIEVVMGGTSIGLERRALARSASLHDSVARVRPHAIRMTQITSRLRKSVTVSQS